MLLVYLVAGLLLPTIYTVGNGNSALMNVESQSARTAGARTTGARTDDECFVTHAFHFAASHRLYNPKLSEQENSDIFGKCANPGGHGHNYELFVTLAGAPDPTAGWVIDREKFSSIVHELVLDRLDHQNLNQLLDVDVTTSENVAKAIWDMLDEQFNTARLVRVRVVETAKNSFDYLGPDH